MVSNTSQKPLWRRASLTTLAVMVFGALLLSACSSTTTGKANTGTPSASVPNPTPTMSESLQNQGQDALQTFQQWIALMQKYGGSVTTYQQQYNSDQQSLAQATTDAQYTKALKTIQSQTKTIQIPAMKQEVTSLQGKLQQGVSSWGQQHTYYDSYNGTTYTKNYEYDNQNGIGGPLWLQEELSTDQTLADYQQTVEDLNMWLYNFQEFKTNYNDKTSPTQVHQTDLDLIKHYGFTDEPVIVVSLSEQELRAYDSNGKLVKAFQVTTGQPDLPTPPGTWWVEGKQHPTTFKSTEPKNSPDYYPPTKINYAMQYHSNGYFLHDAWWRTEFGPGTNYPHQDPDGDPFAGQGSHGCVNMSTDDAAWVYNFVSIYTRIIIY
jgi:hypothetical protein